MFLGTNAPNAKLSVRGTTNYETGLTDDDIPNVKYVNNAFQTINIPLIRQDNTSLTAEDLNAGDPVSRLIGKIDNVTKFEIKSDTITLGDLQIDGTTLRPVTSNDDLILQANGTGSVVAEEVFALGNASSTPTGTSGRIKLYLSLIHI